MTNKDTITQVGEYNVVCPLKAEFDIFYDSYRNIPFYLLPFPLLWPFVEKHYAAYKIVGGKKVYLDEVPN